MQNKNSISSEHHYLPKFYLKGFTDQNRQFAVYNYATKEIKKGMHSPRSHFYIEDRNSIFTGVKKIDYVEEAYSFWDNIHAKILQKIINSSHEVNLDEVDLFHLREFVSQIFWRIPANDKLYEAEFRNNPTYSRLMRLVDKSRNNINTEEAKKLLTSEAIAKATRISVSHASHMSSALQISIGNWEILYSPLGRNVCSDNSIIFERENAKDIFNDNFAFPLSKHHILVRRFDAKQTAFLPEIFNLWLDLAIFKQGAFYCCSSDKKHLEAISSLSMNYTLKDIKAQIFTFLK